MIAMIAAIAERFFFLSDHSDRSDHMETKVNCTKGIVDSDSYQRQSFSYVHYSKCDLILECFIRDSR